MQHNEPPRTPQLVVADALAALLRQQREDPMSGQQGWSSGFKELDQLTGGLRPGSVYLVAGRPGMGKTAFALDLCTPFLRNSAPPAAAGSTAAHGVVLFECLLQSAVTTAQFAMLRSTDPLVTLGPNNPKDWSRVSEAALTLAGSGFWFDDRPLASAAVLEARVSSFASEARAEGHSLGIVVVDPLEQLLKLHPASVRWRARTMTMLRRIAEERNVAVIATVGVRRTVEYRRDHEPGLSDMIGGTVMAQHADVVLLLYRPGYYVIRDREDACDVTVARNRFGGEGRLVLTYERESARFSDPPAEGDEFPART